MSFVIPSQNLRRKLRGTQSRIRFFILRFHTEDHPRQAHDPAPPQAVLNTDMTREARAGNDVVMREDENSGGHPSSKVSDCRRRITTKREPREVRDERSSTTEQHVPRRILGKTTPREQAVAVTTQEALDGSREKTMRIANVGARADVRSELESEVHGEGHGHAGNKNGSA